MNKLIDEIKQFVQERDWQQFHTPANLAKSISIEAGELLECYQWHSETTDLNHVTEELADVMIYCLQMALALDVDPAVIIADKMQKNALKYPVEKAKGKSDKYTNL